MTKYELSLTKDYVPGWTLTDAMRELFQNAVDQEVTVPGNTMFWEYHEEIESFHIGNKLSILEPKSLLLGASTLPEPAVAELNVILEADDNDTTF